MYCLDSSFVVDFLDAESEHHEAAVAWMDEHADDGESVSALEAEYYDEP